MSSGTLRVDTKRKSWRIFCSRSFRHRWRWRAMLGFRQTRAFVGKSWMQLKICAGKNILLLDAIITGCDICVPIIIFCTGTDKTRSFQGASRVAVGEETKNSARLSEERKGKHSIFGEKQKKREAANCRTRRKNDGVRH